MEKNYTIQTVFASVGASISAVFGGWNAGMKWLLLFVIIDYITGVMSAFINKTLSSSIGFRGIVKKVCFFVVVALAYGVGELTNQPLVRDATICFLCANESLSIVENLYKIGVPVPQVLMDAIKLWKNTCDGGKKDGK